MHALLLFALAATHQQAVKPLPPVIIYNKDSKKFTVTGDGINVSQIVEKIAKEERASENSFYFLEPIPDDATVAHLNLREKTSEEVLDTLTITSALKYSLRKSDLGEKPWIFSVCWGGGKVPGDKVRLFKQGGSYNFAVTKATKQNVYEAFEHVLGVSDSDLIHAWAKNKLLAADVIKGIDVAVNDDDPVTVLKSFAKAVRETPEPAEDIALQWTMTNIKSNGASFDATGNKIDFGTGQTSFELSSIADGLNTLFKYGPKDAPLSPVQLLGNTFYIRGPQKNEIRRLFATQIDIPQSQIKLSFNTYVVSGNAKSASQNSLAIKRLSFGQEIAAAYRRSLLDALNVFVAGHHKEIQSEVDCRKCQADLNVSKLLESCQMGIDPNRRLGIAETFLFLAYSPNENLRNELPEIFKATYKEVHEQIERRLLEPGSGLDTPEQRDLRSSLKVLNDAICKRMCQSAQSSFLIKSIGQAGTFGLIEDKQTRNTIEEFLVLVRFKDFDELSDVTNAGDTWKSRYENLQTGENSQLIVKSGLRMDKILKEASEALEGDANQFVDDIFGAWTSKFVPANGKANEGVTSLGTADIALSSRSPGLLSTDTTSFFPFQPHANISLDSLLPLLKRKDPPVTPPTNDAGNGDSRTKSKTDEKADEKKDPPTFAEKAAALGLTSQEIFGLQQLFAQSQMSPYYRSVGSGINIAVLPTMLSGATGAKILLRLQYSADASDNGAGPGDKNKPGPVNLVKSVKIEREILADALDTTKISSLHLDISAPGKRDWEFPILSQNWPLQSWFVGPTMDKTIRHEAIVLVRVSIVPKAMDLAYRFL